MASDYKTSRTDDSDFSFAVRELRKAKAAQVLALDPTPQEALLQ